MKTEDSGVNSQAHPNEMPPASPLPTPPFADSLLVAIQRQKTPLFLMLIAYAIVLIGAGIWGAQLLQLLILPLTAIFIVAVIAWLILELAKQRGSASTVSANQVGGGNVTVSNDANLDEVSGRGGNAQGIGGTVKGGDVEIGKGSHVKNSRLIGGDANSTSSAKPNNSKHRRM